MPLVHLKLIVMALFWASSYPLGRYLGHLEVPSVVVFVRLVVAFFALALIAHVRGQLRIQVTTIHVLQFCFLGFMGFCVHNYLMFKALEHTQANVGAVINGAIPIVVVVLDYLFFGRRLSRRASVGLLFGFFGAALVVTHGDIAGLFTGEIGYGETLFLIAICGWSVFSIASRELFREMSPLTVTTYATLAAAVMLGPAAATNVVRAMPLLRDPGLMAMLCLQAVFTISFGFVWFSEGVKTLGAANASIYLNLVPVFGVALSAFVLSEVPDVPLLIGGTMVVSGLLIVSRAGVAR